MISANVFSVIVATLVFGTFAGEALQIGCSDPDERCLPIRHCSPVYRRIEKNEHLTNATFMKEIHRKTCQPVVQQDTKTHICCRKRHIGCRLNGKPGACLLREQCPTLQTTTERKLMQNPEQNLCYVHDRRHYFCCTDPYCATHKKLCEQEAAPPQAKQPASTFPRCTGANGEAGSLVPAVLCGGQPPRPSKRSVDQRTCCVPPAQPNRLVSHPNAAKLARLPCGTIGLLVKIQDGTYAQRGEFPWMANLVYKQKAICSGTLIHPSYVLTARHCINGGLVRVRLGKHDLLEKPECPPGTTAGGVDCPQLQVQEIAIAQKMRSHTHDVGLLRLAKPADVAGELVRPICLPVYASLRMYLPPSVTITGWGLTEKEKPATVLLKAHTSLLMDDPACAKDYMICAGGTSHSNHCGGDSGGPYQALGVYDGKSRYVQYGIISDGPAYCSNPDRPSRGVLVGYVMDWILDNMAL
ncbi:AGAP001648-PA [Anopheles gambiae str. PEST]|uniref:AGAP001648-PA n=5 Tax=gambiae species complex TaxID=44542 RepID=Q7PXX8_ANOGA|nr:AGAP001648-PA [Anopheles gambiae str. PEST]